MNEPKELKRIVYFTAGAAGMYCGSCMHDNTLARALIRRGCDVRLIPLYTPIRTDETSTADKAIFFGGVNVYLQQKVPLFRYVPRFLDRWIDSPRLLKWATSFGMKTTAADLGALAVSILRGEQGYQRKEVRRLVDWLAGEERPDVLIFTNMLVGGCIPAIRRELGLPVIVTLQGDDIFLDQLLEPFRSQAIHEMQSLAKHAAGFIVNSEYYAEEMGRRFAIPRERFRVVPLGIDNEAFQSVPVERTASSPPTIGYLARLAHEKGLHVLAEAFRLLHTEFERTDVRLHIAGWLGAEHRAYAEGVFAKLREAGLGDKFEYVGEIDRREKAEFLRSLDLFCVPTVYREPKGLFVLEAAASGVPVVAPHHGAFPELLAHLGCGTLVTPDDPRALAMELMRLLDATEERKRLGETGRERVLSDFTADRMAERTWNAVRSILESNQT